MHNACISNCISNLLLWESDFLFISLAPGKFEWNLRYLIFKWISVIDGWGISCEIALIWMSLDWTDDQSTLVQVMAWCCQATSHYLSQCWLRSLSPYGVTRPQWVKYCIKLKHSNEKYCICLWWYWRIFYIKSCDSQHEKYLCVYWMWVSINITPAIFIKQNGCLFI